MKRMMAFVLVVASMTFVACERNEQGAATAPAQTAVATAAPTVADLPDYPGATRVEFRSEPHAGFSRSVEAKFTTGDTFDNVKRFYLAAISAGGWQITSTEEQPGEVKWYLAKGTSTAKVEVETEHGTLQIKLERNDR